MDLLSEQIPFLCKVYNCLQGNLHPKSKEDEELIKAVELNDIKLLLFFISLVHLKILALMSLIDYHILIHVL